jgi:hypothetical protein
MQTQPSKRALRCWRATGAAESTLQELSPAGKIKTCHTRPWGEWRADGHQTVIYGRHPSGRDYRDNDKRPLEIDFSEIEWPAGVTLPWEKPKLVTPDPLDTRAGWGALASQTDARRYEPLSASDIAEIDATLDAWMCRYALAR